MIVIIVMIDLLSSLLHVLHVHPGGAPERNTHTQISNIYKYGMNSLYFDWDNIIAFFLKKNSQFSKKYTL